MAEETLETIILGHISKELKDEIQIGRQVNLAKTILQAVHIHDVVGSFSMQDLMLYYQDAENFDSTSKAIEVLNGMAFTNVYKKD